jgi:hypothetical protein
MCWVNRLVLLKPMVATDIVKEEKGAFAIIPYRLQSFIMVLVGLWDLIDNRYSSGAWDNEAG